VSVSFLAVLLSGNAAWLLYGAAIGNLVILIPNAVGVASSGTTLALMIRARRVRRNPAVPVPGGPLPGHDASPDGLQPRPPPVGPPVRRR